METSIKNWRVHHTLAGEEVRYRPPAPELDAFLRRVRRAVYDPTLDEDAMIELVYGLDNPLLERGVLGGRGAVTRRVFADPVYRVLTDMMDRKRVELGKLDPARAADGYTMSVDEAAAALGVSAGEVRRALRMRRLGAWRKDGVPLLDPRDVEGYRRRELEAPRADAGVALRVRAGNRPGGSARLLAHRTTQVWKEKLPGGGRLVLLAVPPFALAAIRFRAGDVHRMCVLEPAEAEHELRFDDAFGVRGRFRVVEEITDAEEAARRWAVFVPA